MTSVTGITAGVRPQFYLAQEASSCFRLLAFKTTCQMMSKSSA
jgi:hypothetical protein